VRFRLALTVLLTLSPLGSSSTTASAAVPQQVSHQTGACPGGYVALTFDDGPNESTTLRIVSELRAGEREEYSS
jgi:endo-1,4-beta-xylanase